MEIPTENSDWPAFIALYVERLSNGEYDPVKPPNDMYLKEILDAAEIYRENFSAYFAAAFKNGISLRHIVELSWLFEASHAEIPAVMYRTLRNVIAEIAMVVSEFNSCKKGTDFTSNIREWVYNPFNSDIDKDFECSLSVMKIQIVASQLYGQPQKFDRFIRCCLALLKHLRCSKGDEAYKYFLHQIFDRCCMSGEVSEIQVSYCLLRNHDLNYPLEYSLEKCQRCAALSFALMLQSFQADELKKLVIWPNDLGTEVFSFEYCDPLNLFVLSVIACLPGVICKNWLETLRNNRDIGLESTIIVSAIVTTGALFRDYLLSKDALQAKEVLRDYSKMFGFTNCHFISLEALTVISVLSHTKIRRV